MQKPTQKVSQTEIDAMYDLKTMRQSNICLQTLLLILFYAYLYLETIAFDEIYNVSKQLQQNFLFETPQPNKNISDISLPREIGQWLNVTVGRLYAQKPYSKFIPSHLLYKQDSQVPPEIPIDDQAMWVKTLVRNNYITGVRLNAIHESEVTTEGTIYENVVLTKRDAQSSYGDTANETNLGNYTYRTYPSAGYYKEGFVQYIPGNTSLQQTITQVNSLIASDWFSAQLQTFTAEVMVYNFYLKYGVVFAITFTNSNSGVVTHKIDQDIFITEVYDLTKIETQVKLCIMIVWMLIILLLFCSFTKTICDAAQKLWTTQRLNLHFHDLVNFLQIFMGITVFCFYFNLFFASKHLRQFKIPLHSESDFETWSQAAKQFYTFRVLAAIESYILMLAWLVFASQRIPSLGLIFETVTTSSKALLTFTLIVFTLFVTVSVSYCLIFGQHMFQTSTFFYAGLYNFRTILGDINYSLLNQSNPQFSAVCFYIFIIVFCYFVKNFYQAAMIQTYDDLRRRRRLLNDAMARILVADWKVYLLKLKNLILCRRPQIYAEDQQNGFSQTFQYNLAQLKQKVQTKEQFVSQISEKCTEIQQEQEQEFKDNLQQFKIIRESSEGFNMLVDLVVFLLFILVQIALINTINNQTQAVSVQQYIQAVFQRASANIPVGIFKSDDMIFRVNNYQMLTAYSDVVFYPILKTLKSNQTSVLLADTNSFRMTLNLYSQQINQDTQTAWIYPTALPSALDMKILSYNYTQFNANFNFNCSTGCSTTQMNYTNSEVYTESAFGKGGYVFEFNKNFVNPQTNLTLFQLMSQPWNTEYWVSQITFELALYSLNYDQYTLAQCHFEFMQTGQVHSKLHLNSFDVAGYHKWPLITSFILFVIFSLYYLWRFVIDVWTLHFGKGVRICAGENLQSRCLNFMGIELKNLQNRSFFIQCVLTIIMMFKQLVHNCVSTISALSKYSFRSVFNLLEIVTVFLRFSLIIYIIMLVRFQNFQVDSNGLTPGLLRALTEMNQIKYHLNNILAATILLELFYIFKFLKFSILSYLPLRVVWRGRYDILNVLFITWLTVTALTMTTFVMFAPSTAVFTTYTETLIAILSYFQSNYHADDIFHADSVFGPIIIVITSMFTMLLATVFLAIIIGHFLEELEANEIQSEWIHVVIYQIVRKHWQSKREQTKLPQFFIKFLDFILPITEQVQTIELEPREFTQEQKVTQNQDQSFVNMLTQNNELVDQSVANKSTLPIKDHIAAFDQKRKAVVLTQIKNLWSDADQGHAQAQSGFWLHHLEENLSHLVSQEFSLNKFNAKIKVPSQFGNSNFLNSGENDKKLQIKFFTSRLKTVQDKFKLWKHIDHLHLMTEFEKIRSEPVVQVAGDLRGLLQQNTEKWASEVILQSQFASSALQNENFQQVSAFLVAVWNNYLTSDEQFQFFFRLMSKHQQARLWNALVFPYNYFVNTETTRCRLNDMIKAVNFRTKKIIKDGQGDGRNIYTASVMRDLWRQMTGQPVGDFWDKIKLKEPKESEGPREVELALDYTRQICSFVEMVAQTCKDFQSVLRGQEMTEQQLYSKYCQLLTEQKALGGKERLPLWMLMKPSQKIDLLLSLNMDSEISMLITIMPQPNMQHAEDCLNKHIFNKYSALVRVQAQSKSLQLTTQRMVDMQAGDESLLQYCLFLKSRYLNLETQLEENTKVQRKHIQTNNLLKNKLLDIAYRLKLRYKGDIMKMLELERQLTEAEIEQALQYEQYLVKHNMHQEVAEEEIEVADSDCSEVMQQFNQNLGKFLNRR